MGLAEFEAPPLAGPAFGIATVAAGTVFMSALAGLREAAAIRNETVAEEWQQAAYWSEMRARDAEQIAEAETARADAAERLTAEALCGIARIAIAMRKRA